MSKFSEENLRKFILLFPTEILFANAIWNNENNKIMIFEFNTDKWTINPATTNEYSLVYCSYCLFNIEIWLGAVYPWLFE